jgi:flagellar biosynthesis protein FliP
MSKKLFTLALAGLVLNLFILAPSVNGQTQEDETKHINKVRGQIARIGTGPKARVEIRLRDETKLKGFIGESDETQFVVVDTKTGARTKLTYPQVKKVKSYRLSALKTALYVGLGVGVAFLAITLICVASEPCRAE